MRSDEKFPPEIDLTFYRSRYSDLNSLDDKALLRHYEVHGRREGRIASSVALKSSLLEQLNSHRPILEIGPFNRPLVTGDDVYYFDIMNQADLEERAVKTGRQGQAPFIHFVSPTGNLSVVDRTFSAVVSAHCIEHQPDLVNHLQSVAKLLDSGGHYFIIAPDKRYCFDYFIPESTIAEVIEAYYEKRKVHSLSNVIKQYALSTHNGAPKHWSGDHSTENRSALEICKKITSSIERYKNSNGSYIDVHAWRFTPESFRSIVTILYNLGLSPLKSARVYDTPRPMNEFTAILEKAN
jgi:hypothetical protein